jgi:hypothetical protein
MPARILIVVDFPAPLGPDVADHLARLDLEAHPLQRDQLTVPARDQPAHRTQHARPAFGDPEPFLELLDLDLRRHRDRPANDKPWSLCKRLPSFGPRATPIDRGSLTLLGLIPPCDVVADSIDRCGCVFRWKFYSSALC